MKIIEPFPTFVKTAPVAKPKRRPAPAPCRANAKNKPRVRRRCNSARAAAGDRHRRNPAGSNIQLLDQQDIVWRRCAFFEALDRSVIRESHRSRDFSAPGAVPPPFPRPPAMAEAGRLV
jgi:hypothetical protein